MEWGFLIPATLIASGPIAWVAVTWIRARHGYPLDNLSGDRADLPVAVDADRRVALLTGENERMRGQIDRLEERLTVLERIATDPAERLGREIDRLRVGAN